MKKQTYDKTKLRITTNEDGSHSFGQVFSVVLESTEGDAIYDIDADEALALASYLRRAAHKVAKIHGSAYGGLSLSMGDGYIHVMGSFGRLKAATAGS